MVYIMQLCEQDQDGTDPTRKLSAKLYDIYHNGICHTVIRYDIYHCCVYNEKLLMMDRGTVRNI